MYDDCVDLKLHMYNIDTEVSIHAVTICITCIATYCLYIATLLIMH